MVLHNTVLSNSSSTVRDRRPRSRRRRSRTRLLVLSTMERRHRLRKPVATKLRMASGILAQPGPSKTICH
jgi:hypothetical protein